MAKFEGRYRLANDKVVTVRPSADWAASNEHEGECDGVLCRWNVNGRAVSPADPAFDLMERVRGEGQ